MRLSTWLPYKRGKSPKPEIVLEYMYTTHFVSGPNVIRSVENKSNQLEKIYKSEGLEVELVEKTLTVSFLSTILIKTTKSATSRKRS